ncbi:MULTISPECIES: site-specific integrase [unclassified Nocardia]|uniref:tyrosine-type recombinase/integrase n=1 Tax=unclassified Nocardia TaxID=2637762 RepID=UPI00278C647E|nr:MULTISPECIES: site-specific integrase [unclassified Nocardia]
MSSIRTRVRKDGTAYHSILFRHNGTQSSRSFDDIGEALKFQDLVDKVGPDKALDIIDAIHDAVALGTPTLGQWLATYIDGLTGVEPGGINRYQAIVRNDFGEDITELPLPAVDDAVIGKWVQGQVAAGAAGKTIANKHGFLYAAMAAAVRKNIIVANPCEYTNLPRHSAEVMTFLEPEEFKALLAEIPTRWRPLTMFLVCSGARFSEATALRVKDINQRTSTCRISRAWKDTRQKGESRWQIGIPKTKKSIRTINLPPEVMDELELAGRKPNEFLFLNTRGKHVGNGSFYHNVWKPAVARACDAINGKTPRIHDLRHTCASWMISAGVNLVIIQEHLGHESITTTVDRYGHLDRRSGKVAAAAVSAMLSGGVASDPPPTKQPSDEGTAQLTVVDGQAA